MDVHPPKNGIFIGIDPYPFGSARNGAQYSAAFGEDALHRFVLVPHKVTHLQFLWRLRELFEIVISTPIL